MGIKVKDIVKGGIKHVAAVPLMGAKNVLNVGKAGMSILKGGSTDSAIDQYMSDSERTLGELGSNITGGIVKDSYARRDRETAKSVADMQAKAEQDKLLEEDKLALNQRANTLLGRNRVRGFSNTLLGAGEV
jgi:hypothetical protein